MRAASSAVFVLALALVACRDDGVDLVPRPPPPDPTFAVADGGSSGDATTTGATSTGDDGAPTACAASETCTGGTVCRAPGQPTPTPLPGEFVCGACVPTADPALWCADDAACCDAEASCVNGFCRGPDVGTSEDTGTSSGDSSSSTSGSTGA